MKRWRNITIGSLFATLVLVGGVAMASSSGELLQQGLYAEEIEGDIAGAITSYEKIISDSSAPKNHRAQALYRQGMCYLKNKEKSQAATVLEKLVAEYPGQSTLVEKAMPILAGLQNFDPAALMPPETLMYLELGSPGEQIETLLGMLKDTPFENPLAMIPMNAGGPNPLAGLLNPSMIAEFKKIRSSAIGIMEFSDRGGPPSMVFVLHPGESDALRGMLLAGLGMAGMPGESIEGMSTLCIQGELSVAYDDKVIIATHPVERLPWCIKQYKGLAAESSLASSSTSFAKLDKGKRQRNAATLWVNVDDLYAKMQQLPQIPHEIQALNGVVNLASIDDLTITKSIESDGLELDAAIQFKEGMSSMAYGLIQTPKINVGALKGVPASTFGIASFSLGEAGSPQAVKLQELAKNAMGLDLSNEFFDGIDQVSLFALPLDGSATNAIPPADMPFRLGMAIVCSDPSQVMQTISMLKGMIPPTMNLCTAQLDQIILVALNRGVIDASIAALKDNTSINASGVLSGSIDTFAPKAHKLVLMSAGGAVRLAARNAQDPVLSDELNQKIMEAYETLAESMDATTLALYTDEQPHALSLKARLTGIPPLSQIIDPVLNLQRISDEAQKKKAEARAAEQKKQRLAKMRTATIDPAPAVPVIDGDLDDAWNGSNSHELANVLYASSDTTHTLAANYRMMWDNDRLYMFIDVTDSSPVRDPALQWFQNDSIELYLDATDRKSSSYGETDYQFAFMWDKTNPQMEEKKHNRAENVEYMIKTTETGYRVEVAFPWETLRANPSAGARIGMDVQINDNRGHGKRDAKIAWNDWKDWACTNPQYLGRIELAGQQE